MRRTPIPRLVDVSVRRPWAVLGLCGLLALIALAVAVGRFAMTTDTGALISADVPWRQQERAMETAFPQLRDNLLIVIDGATPELAEQATARLAGRLARDKAHFRIVSRPDGGDYFAREGLLFGSRDEVRRATAALVEAQPLLGPLAADPSLRGVTTVLGTVLDGVANGSATLARIDRPMRALADAGEQVLAGRPAFFSWQALLAGEGGAMRVETRRLILVQPVLNNSALMPGEAAEQAVRAAANAMRLDPAHGVSVRLTGEVPLADEEFATLQENIGAVGAVMLAAMLATLWFAVRSARLVGAIMGTILVGLVVTMALGLLAVGRLNLISVAFIPLFVGLGVDFGIQLCVRFNAERAAGAGRAAAMRGAADALGAPLLLAAGAVFLGFGAFLPTAYVGIAELGVIAGLGMVVALAFSVTLLPALVMLLGGGAPRGEVGFSAMAPVDRFLDRRRGLILWAFAISMAGSIALLPWVAFDFNPLDLRDPDAPAMRTLADLTRDPDRTPNVIDVLAPNQAEATRLSARLAALPAVERVVSVDSFVPADQPAKLVMIGDAQLLLDLTLSPFDVAPPPSDAQTVAALSATAVRLRQAAAGPGGAQALRLALVLDGLAHAMPAKRAAAQAAIVTPLGVMLDQVRAALQAQPVTRATLPPAIVRDWVAPDGRQRLEVSPRGDAHDNAVIRRFRDAVAGVTPALSGLPVATQAAAGYGCRRLRAGRIDRLRAGEPAAVRGAARRARGGVHSGARRALDLPDPGHLRADRPADQLRQHHRLSVAVRHRRGVPHLFRDGVAGWRDRAAAIEPRARRAFQRAGDGHGIRRTVAVGTSGHGEHGQDPDDLAGMDPGLCAHLRTRAAWPAARAGRSGGSLLEF